MDAFTKSILFAFVVSVALSGGLYLFYRAMLNGFGQPVILYNRLIKRFKNRSHDKKVKLKIEDYRTISKEEKSSVLGSIVILILFVIIVFALLFDVVYFVAVTSNSMKPTFESGDLVLMQSMNKDPKVGDIILFNQKRYLVPITHRITSVTPEGVRTKGDAANPDRWVVPRENIQSKAIQIAGKPIVIKDVGEYFILETEKQRYGKYGQEYTFIKNIFKVIKLYGYGLCILAIMGYLFLTIKETKS